VIPRDLRSYGDMARRAEEMGWDAISTGDNTCLLYDPFVCLAAAAAATHRVLLMTDVTNSVTRHESVIAAAAGSLQDLSGGRFVLGIGRGDSAIHFLGLEPASVAEFETYVTVLQSYLAGRKVVANGVSSQITWLQRDSAELITPTRVVNPSAAPKVPLSIAATGPKITGLASRLAERVTLNVGADPRRIARSINHIRESRAAAGLDPEAISIGAYLLCAVDDDEEAACRQVRGLAAVYIRFSAMKGRPLNDLEEADAAAAARMVRARVT
jgi:5,10-methylenetetrahydromethanopterin reductase